MCWMRVLSTTMVLVMWVVAIKPWCVGHHCVVIQSPHHHLTTCVHHGVCRLRCVMGHAWPIVCVSCGWRRLVGLVVGCMALPSTYVPLCHSSQMALTTHAHFLLHNTKWMARWLGDLLSCIGWLFSDHSFALSNHNCILFFLKPSFLLTNTSSRMLDYLWDELDDCNKCLILFLPIPVVSALRASILWSLNGTVFLPSHCLCDIV